MLTTEQVDFKVNNVKQNYAMKLGEGGEAFFVFETSDDIPEGLQTSPIISPTTSPERLPAQGSAPSSTLQEPEYLDLSIEGSKSRSESTGSHGTGKPLASETQRTQVDQGRPPRSLDGDINSLTPLSISPQLDSRRPVSDDWSTTSPARAALERSTSEELLPSSARTKLGEKLDSNGSSVHGSSSERQGVSRLPTFVAPERSHSPPLLSTDEAVNRAISLSKKLSGSNIPTQVTETGDLMLDMTGYKSSEEESLRAEVIARKILAEELEGNYDIGALIGADENGNLWIYSSEEAKEAAGRRTVIESLTPEPLLSDAASDPGYHSDEDKKPSDLQVRNKPQRRRSELPPSGLVTPPKTPPDVSSAGDPNRNYAKTLRLTSDQLKALNLKSGPNLMSFSVNRATCQAYMYYWTYSTPVVISDIDGTITKYS